MPISTGVQNSGYPPGVKPSPVPVDTQVKEFDRLGQALQSAVDRSEELVERQSQFIGNASHELQTPLAIIGNRVEWLLDGGNLTQEQGAELFKIQSTLGRAVRLNKTLLLFYYLRCSHEKRSIQSYVSILNASITQKFALQNFRFIAPCTERVA